MYILKSDNVVPLDSVAGLRKWVDYVPVRYRVGVEADSFDDEGAVGVVTLEDADGLVPWVDYIPVYDTTPEGGEPDTGKEWSFSDDGYIPIIESE